MAIVTASRLTSKYQATIPVEVRRVLRLKQGDGVQFEIDGERVTVRRQTASDRTYLRGVEANLSVWNSPDDDEAYGDLWAVECGGRGLPVRGPVADRPAP